MNPRAQRAKTVAASIVFGPLLLRIYMATEHITYVDPNGTGDYVSASSWEADLGDTTGNLPSDDLIAVATCRCTGGTADTTAVTINGWTTSADAYIKIWTDTAESYRHNGTYQTGNVYRLIVSGSTAINIVENHVRIIGLIVESDTTSAIGDAGSANEAGLRFISHNIIKITGGYKYAVKIYDSGNTFVIYNNLLISESDVGTSVIGINAWSNTIYIYSNTIVGGNNGVVRDAATVIAKNNLIYGSTNAASGTFAAGSGYNATNLASMGYTVTGGATADRVSQAFTFAGVDDYHLASNDTGALGYGLNLYNDSVFPFQTDIDGQDRGGAAAAWDIGADEYVAAGAALPVFLYHYMHH